MSRPGRKRRLVARKPSGSSRKSDRPIIREEYALPVIEQLTMREAILGSRTAVGEIREPFTHIRPLLTDAQIAAAERFQRLYRRSCAVDGPKQPGCNLGAQVASGAISSGIQSDADLVLIRREYSDACSAMSIGPRMVVRIMTEARRPIYSGGDHVRWFQNNISRYLSEYKFGLNQLVQHFGYDKVAGLDTYQNPAPVSIAVIERMESEL